MKKIYPLILICLVTFLLLLSCKSEQPEVNNTIKTKKKKTAKKIIVKDTLRVLVSNDFVELNLIDSLSQGFLEESNTKILWENGGNKKDIIEKLATSSFENYPDLVLGLSNVFLTELDSLDIFRSLDNVYFSKVRSNNRFDKKKRFVPYQYSYLALIKKSSNKSKMPISFGELQEEDYFDKVIIPDALGTEIGRALFNNIEGIFKFHGYAACWNRIRGSIFAVVDDEKEAFDRFWDEDDKFIFYPVTKVIAGYEAGYPQTMDFSYMSEGSYKIIHSAAITKRCMNETKAEVFLLWLHKSETQSLIVKATNYYPIVEVAAKSQGHRIIDYPKNVMNNKINQKVVAKYLSEWLDFWKVYKGKI